VTGAARRRALGLAAAALLAGCDAGRPPASAPRSAPEAAAQAPRAAAPAAPEPALPEPGAARAERSGDGYTVLANEARPFDILTELGAVAGFRAERGADPVPEEPRSLALRGVPLERALAEILAPGPYHVHYEPGGGGASGTEPPGGEPPIVLARVTLGALPEAQRAGPSAKDARAARHARPDRALRGLAQGRKPSAPAADPDAARREEEAERQREVAAEQESARAETVERQWSDPRPGARLEAIELMEPEGEDRGRLESLLREDPSPELRAAAAEQLAQGDAFEVKAGLLAGLSDPDPRVLAAVVRGLEDVYDEAPDPQIREAVTALREHRDAGVREAVAEFEEWIE
jgi:hypothetical protein